MNSPIGKDAVKQALSAHAAIGLLASALLYLVCLTGALAVIDEEWQRIEQPDAPEMAAIAPEAVQKAVAQVLDDEKALKKTSHLYVHLPTPGLPRTTITTDHRAVHVEQSGQIAGREENGWTEFLGKLHYQLHLPGIIGLTIVGILGVMMVALSLSGIIAHPRIFRDAFRLRARDRGGIGLADWHNRLGVWTLPFSLAIALTGAMIGMAAVTGYGLAASFYEGDMERVYAPIFGGEGKANAHDAPPPDVAAALRDMTSRATQAQPYYAIIHDPLTRGQHVQIIATHPRRLIFGEYYDYDAAGRFRGKAGLSDGALGQQVAASSYNLHFGNYGGLIVKIAYLAFGIALCAIIATGTSIWLGKRERRGLHHPRLRNAWDGVVWGIPAVLAITLAVRLIAGQDTPLIAIFWGLLALVLGLSIAWPPLRAVRTRLQQLLGLALVACLIGAVLPQLG